MWETLANSWHIITAAVATLDIVLVFFVIPWILAIKKESISAIAWCLLVILLPLFGILLFIMFGYQSVHRPLIRKRKHRARFRSGPGAKTDLAGDGDQLDPGYEGLARLAVRLNASPPIDGNRVDFFYEGHSTFDALFADIEQAKHHIHVQFFIFRLDGLGNRLLDLLTKKAKAGVEVRLLTDGVGARMFKRHCAQGLCDVGGRWAAFLPVSIWRRRLQVNLRNHRKIVVIDGRIAYTGGLNVGVEYLGESRELGYWRDTFLRLEGPGVEPVQRVFIEDWDFASGEHVNGPKYYPAIEPVGDVTAQVIAAGPDQDLKGIREIYFAAILKAHKRLWITSPYYVPDQGIRDGLCLSARSGVDVRLLLPQEADHLMTYYAGRYYLPELLDAGVKVYAYAKGFIHAKVLCVDGQWASVGTANLDNRSLLLNFEVNCLFHTPRVVAELERQFLCDLEDAIELEPRTYAKRPLPGRFLENVFRLFAPVL